MNITVVAKRREGQWRSASIKDGQFQDANITESMSEVLADSVGSLLSTEFPDGSEVEVTIKILLPTQPLD